MKLLKSHVCINIYTGFELPTHFSVDKDMVHFVHNKSYDLKSSANLTMQEAMQLESVRQRPTSAYKRLSHALSSTRKDQLAQKLNVLSLGAHRMASATMKTEKQSNSKTHLQEFCSWVCMKRWCRSHFNLQRRYETELLIDLTAGCVVDAD